MTKNNFLRPDGGVWKKELLIVNHVTANLKTRRVTELIGKFV